MATKDMAEKRAGAAVPLSQRARTLCNTMWPGLRSTSVPSGIFIQPFGHNRHGPKIGWGWVGPFFLGVAGSPSNTKLREPRPTCTPSGILVHGAVWPKRTLAENWGMCPFRGGGAGSPSNTIRVGRGLPLRPRPTSVPSGILIHAAVWPQ